MNVNVNLIVESEIQIKCGIMINVDPGVKKIFVKKIIFGTLLHIVANYWQFSDYMWWNCRFTS